MTDEPLKYLIDLDIGGTVVRVTLDEAKALFVVLQDVLADEQNEDERLMQ